MGRGRVDPAPPAPINSDPRGEKKGGENGSKRGEKPTEREREEQSKQRNQKNQGYRQGNRDRQSGRRKKKDKKEKPARKETPTGVSAEEAPLLSLGLTIIATAAPPRTATVIASSTARDHRLR
jgi:hypothetical protein